VVKKPATKKPAPRKAAARKSVARKPASRKPAAKPVARKPAAKKAIAAPLPKSVLLDMVTAQLDDAKAEAISTIDLAGKGAIADFMVVASGRSSRHVGAIADQLVEKLKGAGYRDLRVEGMPQCDWVLVDAGDVVVHLFRPEVRSFYNLEKLWSAHTPHEQRPA
jgi:ribosome-associated protein